MKRFFDLLLLFLFAVCGPTFSQEAVKRNLLLEVGDFPPEQLGKGLFVFDEYHKDVVLSYFRGTLMMLATTAEAEVLKERGYDFSVVMEDTNSLNLYKRAFYGETMKLSPVYHTYERILEKVDALAKRYPKLIKKFVIGITSQERRDIYAIKISNDVATDHERPAILFNGCHHSDEIMGAEICIALIEELVENYDKDPRVTDWLKRYEILVVPVVNVDGHYIVTHNIDPRWRKNARDTNGNGTLYEYTDGVDINRNYDFNWAHGGSDDPANPRYRGPYPFSEAENLAMRRLVESKKFILSITYHSQGEVIYYPWDWRGRKAPDDKLLTEIAGGIAGKIKTMEGDTTYRAEYGAGTVGQSYPWMYGRYGTFDFVVETGKGTHLFPENEVPGIVRSNLEGARYLLERGKGPGLTGKVTDSRTAKPLHAVVWFPGLETEDVDRRTTNPRTGNYWRLLSPGRYDVMVSKEGYMPKMIRDVEVKEGEWTRMDFALMKASPSPRRER